MSDLTPNLARIQRLVNQLTAEQAMVEFMKCCGSTAWSWAMNAGRPFASENEMMKSAEKIWFSLTSRDWLEAFSHHPRIGENMDVLREKFSKTLQWSTDEQKGVNTASEATLQALQSGNHDYEKKFGHVFLVCATGKTADEMLALLRSRMQNTGEQELKVAAEEQNKITQIRIKKWIQS